MGTPTSCLRLLACLTALLLSGVAHAAQTRAVGGTGGTAFNKPCPDGVLVGFEVMWGKTSFPPGDYVNGLRGICRRADKAGNWVGDHPIFTTWVGKQTGNSARRTCPTGRAVSGFSGRAGLYLDRLTLRCRKLGENGLLGSGTQDLSAVGGSGGDPTGFIGCSSNTPAKGFVGKAGSVIDRFALDCSRLDPPVPGAFVYVRPAANTVLGPRSVLEFAASGNSLFEYQVCFERMVSGRSARFQQLR